MRADSPRVSILTPAARGAIAVLRVWGGDALSVVDACFRPARGRGLSNARAGEVRFGRLGDNGGDEVVVVVTGDEPPEVEVHCHGGSQAVALVVNALVASGAERRGPSAWVRRQSKSFVEAEARVDLARAPTARSAQILLEQGQCALREEVERIIHAIDTDPARAAEWARALIERSKIGLRLISGWKVVLAGRPNVGKSRLMNALVGYARAVVDPTAGTTRDLVTASTSIDGWPVELTDTAGLRASDDPIEREGVSRARSTQARADLTVLVLDTSEPLTATDLDLVAADPDALVVANKCDLAPAWTPREPAWVSVSAERGDGITRLLDQVASRLGGRTLGPGAAVPFRPRQERHLERLIAALSAGDAEGAKRAGLNLIGDPAG